MIEAQDLHKRFGKVEALDGVSFVAPDSRITGLLGPNGAGKSTTLRILYATLAADSGTACVDGDVVSVANTGLRRRVGVLPHNAGLYPALTARENIEYFARLCGLDRAGARKRTGELIELMDLQDI